MENFIIVDFGASLNHTHHKQSLYSYSSLIKLLGHNVKILVPKGSQLKNPKYDIHKVLYPGTHPIGFEIRDPKSYIPGLIGKAHYIGSKYKLTFIVKIIAYLVSKRFLKIYKKLGNSQTKVLFPTACAFSIIVLEKMLKKGKIQEKFFIRLTNTSENRGILSEKYNEEFLIKLSQNFQNICIGYENKGKVELVKNSYFAPFPPIYENNNFKKNSDKITISFLGYPTKDKGYDHIQDIIYSVSRTRKDINWIIQDYEIEKSTMKYENLPRTVKIFNGKISSIEMENALKDTSLICLPYDPEKFSKNVSAMLYTAMDFDIPAITLAGTAFCQDLLKFQCSYVVENVFEIIKTLQSISLDKIEYLRKNCKNYNDYRKFLNLNFLDLK